MKKKYIDPKEFVGCDGNEIKIYPVIACFAIGKWQVIIKKGVNENVITGYASDGFFTDSFIIYDLKKDNTPCWNFPCRIPRYVKNAIADEVKLIVC